jgi:hypothetical protein
MMEEQAERQQELLPCPCCGSKSLEERGAYEVCPVCEWEDDGQDDPNADEIWGGPNGDLSLTKARENWKQYGSIYGNSESGI